MRFIVLFFSLLSTLFALSSNHKIVIETFSNRSDAKKTYEHLLNDPHSVVSQFSQDEAFIIHYRKSGSRYIIAAEPFKNKQIAESVLQKMAPNAPHGFVSRGVADDIQPLLKKHRSGILQEHVPVQKETPKTDNTPPAAVQTPAPAIKNQDPIKKPQTQEESHFSLWIAVGILLLIAYILWRERTIRNLQKNYKELSEEKALIKNSIQAKNDFIAMMSHEIRAPINAIMGMSHLVLESSLTTQQHSQISKIKDSTSVLLTLINDILDHSKIEAGKVTIEQIPFDLNTLLDDISNIVSHKAQEKNLELIFDIDRSVPNKLIGDPLRLLQVLVNLLNNAIKFTDEGSVVLRARGQQISRLNLKISFEVIDTGIGMNPEQITRLFQSYTQADETISRKYGGTGLGLAICKNLISLMGGTIKVRSTPGEGSAFSFDIKLHSDFDYEKRHYRLPTKDLMSKNALILDTNPDSIAVLQRGLEYFHYEVKGVVDSLDAVALFKSYHFDMVFIDTRMNLCGEFKKLLQSKIKNDELKLIWMGEDLKKIGGVILQKPFSQLNIFNIILSMYGYMDQTGKHQNNTKKLKESLKKFAGETLLLAEDNEINRSIISGLLNGTDINIVTATTGREAVDTVEINPDISVILMDIQMPIMDGFEAAKLIRQDPEKDLIPIIAVTGNTLESDIQNISNAGMNGHIAKPIDVNTFYTTLYYSFEKSRNQTKKPISA